MSVIISKSEDRTIIATTNRKYTISQSPSKGIELLICSAKMARTPSDELGIRLWIPYGTKTPKEVIENAAEIAIYPIPLKVLEDIQERTNGEIEIEDVTEEAGEEDGKEFYMRTKGYILMATM